MKEHPSYPWDHYSDQPCIMRDRRLKRMIYRRAIWQASKSFILLPLVPIFALVACFRKVRGRREVGRSIGLSVHVETECEGKTIVPFPEVQKMITELGVNQLLVRIPLADRANFQTYIDRIEALSEDQREVTVNLVQDRFMLDDPILLDDTLNDLIPRLKGKVEYIHVGNAYNRRKWGFYHFGEYYQFFQSIRAVTQAIAPEIKLIGGSVIDFELPPMLGGLFHFRKGGYDGYGVQLYVDRRGAPENKQFGFDFLSKINFIDTMRHFSWKARGALWITEINWPLKETGKFSPCKGEVLVDEQTQADFLVRSYLLAIASAKVRTCYWHQLVAPGYGLVDNRGRDLFKKRPSYYAFKALNSLLKGAVIVKFHNGNYQGISGFYHIQAENELNGKPTTVSAYWSNSGPHHLECDPACLWLNQDGSPKPLSDASAVVVSSSVIYSLTANKSSRA